MRVNVYGNELRRRVKVERKVPKGTEVEYVGVQFFVGPDYKHTPDDDDTSAITFWYHNEFERKELRAALEEALRLVNESELRT